MAPYLYAHLIEFDIQVTLTFYSKWEQTTKCTFYLRNLKGTSEAEQVNHAREILGNLASELYYLTWFGIDKGVIRSGGKKVKEVVFPEYKPAEKALHFVYGVRLDFLEHFGYCWQKQVEKRQKKAWALSEADRDAGWQRQIVRDVKKRSIRIPCMIRGEHEPGYFFRYLGPKKRGRKVVGWTAVYDPADAVFQQFIGRFYPNGNLSLRKERLWIESERYVVVNGVKWGPPKLKKTTVPQKSRLASQPQDDTEFVYLIRMGQKLIFKIGKTNNPQKRLASLQTASPFKLKLEHVFKADNAAAAEETLHGHFHKSRMEGEWFQLDREEHKVLKSVAEFRDGYFWIGEKQYEVADLLGK